MRRKRNARERARPREHVLTLRTAVLNVNCAHVAIGCTFLLIAGGVLSGGISALLGRVLYVSLRVCTKQRHGMRRTERMDKRMYGVRMRQCAECTRRRCIC